MSQPDRLLVSESQNILIFYEINYDRIALASEHQQLLSTMTTEQRQIYDKIILTVAKGRGGLFFLYGYGGTGNIIDFFYNGA